MHSPVGIQLELTSDQLTQVVREVLTFNLSTCQSTESKNILRKAILILNARDDAHWISETYSTSSTQTYLCNEDDYTVPVSIKEEDCAIESEFHVDNCTVENLPSPKSQDSSANTVLSKDTFVHTRDISLLKSNTQLPLLRTGRRARMYGSVEWESGNYTNDSTDGTSSMVVPEVTSCSSDYNNVTTLANIALEEQEKEMKYSLCLVRQDMNIMGLMKPLQEESKTVANPLRISNTVINDFHPKSDWTEGEVLSGIISVGEQPSAKSIESRTCVQFDITRPLTATSIKKKENEEIDLHMFEGHHQNRNGGIAVTLGNNFNCNNHQEDLGNFVLTDKLQRNIGERALSNGIVSYNYKNVNNEGDEENRDLGILKPVSLDIRVSSSSNAFGNLHGSLTHQRMFSKNNNVNTQMKPHTGKGKFNCAMCSKAFPLKSHLIRHIRTHTGEKPFKCTWCNRAFSTKSSLIRHLRIHTGEKIFKCTTCSKAFSRKDALLEHTRTHSTKGLLRVLSKTELAL